MRFTGTTTSGATSGSGCRTAPRRPGCVISEDALYIMGVSGTEKVEVGEWVLFDITDHAFTSATDGAVEAFYRRRRKRPATRWRDGHAAPSSR